MSCQGQNKAPLSSTLHILMSETKLLIIKMIIKYYQWTSGSCGTLYIGRHISATKATVLTITLSSTFCIFVLRNFLSITNKPVRVTCRT